MSLILEKDICLKPYSTIGIGGRAKYFCVVKDRFQMRDLVKKCNASDTGLFMLGRGSNLYFSDQEFDGLVALNRMHHIAFQKSIVTVGSGYSFAHLGIKSSNMGLSGLEFASGIPGSVGGAVFMNAGANGCEVADCLVSCLCVDEKGKFVKLDNEMLQFNYRSSLLHQQRLIVVEATFALKLDGDAKKRQKELLDQRLQSQPYEEKTAGCVFKNPEGASAGKLIEECGLKGYQIGDIMVSQKHANFFINLGNATSDNMDEMIEAVQKKVRVQSGQMLQLEVKRVESIGETVV